MIRSVMISVVIPIYQVENYLRECVESVLAQTYERFELILVDDGSTDASARICDEYVQKDDRIITIHQKNQGLSDARNKGVIRSTGDYVLFLDSDDVIRDINAFQLLVDRVQKTDADVTSFSFCKFGEATSGEEEYFSQSINMPLGFSKNEQLRFLFSHGLYIACAWNKLIRRSLLDESMRFEKGIYSEDIDWCARLLLRAGSFDYLAAQLYGYRQRGGSIRHTINDKKCLDLTNNILKCMALIAGADGAERWALMRYTAFQYGTFFMVQAQAQNPQPENICRLAEHRWILKHHGGNKKLLCLHISCSIMGCRATCTLIRKLLGSK